MPSAITSGPAPMTRSRSGAKVRPSAPNEVTPPVERNRLDGGVGGAVGVLLADATRHRGGGADRASPNASVYTMAIMDSVSATVATAAAPSFATEDVDHGKDGLHHHLEHHRNGEEEDRASDGPLGVVVPGATRPASGLPELGEPGAGRHVHGFTARSVGRHGVRRRGVVRWRSFRHGPHLLLFELFGVLGDVA